MEDNLVAEKKEILKRYRRLLKALDEHVKESSQKLRLRKAFNVAVEAHKNMRRKSGEPYIYHPIAVAQIVAEEMGLGVTSSICALLHDTVEDTELSLEDIERMFGQKPAKIIDGLTKIEGVFDLSKSIQAENFRKIVLTLSDDVRVILIKIADRLHNMRTLEHMRRDKQLKIASETLFLYAPLAHRLGLYNIKTELEDLALKYTEPDAYIEIEAKLEKAKPVRDRFISRFVNPIRKTLEAQGIPFEIKGRTKSIYSIYNKVRNKGVAFEEIYDIFAIRIILDVLPDQERTEIWRAYSLVTDIYQPKPDRLRDWISFPRANGYESLHITVMSPTGKWVEVQIRSKRMDEKAEKGFAAHWKYKENESENAIDEWISKIRELIDSHKEGEAIDLIDAFKLDLYSEEIFVFTPKGELRTLPSGATALDFAYEIHSELGDNCLGAKVNNKLVPLSHKLQSGDQIEIISSEKQQPKEDWLNFAITPKARSKIKDALREERRAISVHGKEVFERKMRRLRYAVSQGEVEKIVRFFGLNDQQEFFYRVGKGIIDSAQIREFYKTETQKSWYGYLTQKLKKKKEAEANGQMLPGQELLKKLNETQLVIGEQHKETRYSLGTCCSPIPGDEVFGYMSDEDGIQIHKTSCPKAVDLLSKFASRVVKVRWADNENPAFLVGLKVSGFDEVGIVNRITRLISSQMKVNMRSLSFDGNDGIFEGRIMLFVQDTRHLDALMEKLKKISGVIGVERING
jgi:GTP diphosphokinase / guanosine-3',5'-bis(diphosphate) 3'-diphosphatase